MIDFLGQVPKQIDEVGLTRLYIIISTILITVENLEQKSFISFNDDIGVEFNHAKTHWKFFILEIIVPDLFI